MCNNISSIKKCILGLYFKPVTKIRLIFYDKNDSIIHLTGGNDYRINYGGKHINIEDALKRIIHLFDSLPKKFTIEFKDEDLKTKYDSLMQEIQIAGSSSKASTTTLKTEISKENQGNDPGYSKNVDDLIIRSQELSL